MKENVIVYFDIPAVSVNDDYLRINSVNVFTIENSLPDSVNSVGVNSIGWSDKMGTVAKGFIALKNGGVETFEDHMYPSLIQPYVTLWEKEKNRILQDQIQSKHEFMRHDNRKERSLKTLSECFHEVLDSGFVRSSLGFDADIRPSSIATLMGTQATLEYSAKTIESPKTIFRDFYGDNHELSKSEIDTLIYEINSAQNHIRELKYSFKNLVEQTSNNAELDLVLESCVYTTLDFSKKGDTVNASTLDIKFDTSIKDRVDLY